MRNDYETWERLCHDLGLIESTIRATAWLFSNTSDDMEELRKDIDLLFRIAVIHRDALYEESE
jgi:hypothetical protein